MECLSYCIAERIDLSQVEKKLRSYNEIHVSKYWQVLELRIALKNAYCYIFANGTVVSWNIHRYDINDYFELITPALHNRLEQPLFDGFSYSYADKLSFLPHEYFNIECITLNSIDRELKLSMSYGLSQSIKLKFYEDKLDRLITRYSPYIHQLSVTGKLTVSRAEIRKIIGEILQVKSELNLTSSFLSRPKFFWQFPGLEQYFELVERYLEVPIRAGVLNQQIDALDEIFDMFDSYLEGRHSRNLEIIIIVLIAIEIISNFLNLHLSL